MIALAIPFLGLLIILIIYIKFLRYGSSREIIMSFIISIQGRKSIWIRDPSLAHRILQASSSKGIGLENLLSYQAFQPVLSLESVDDSEWIRMKKNFLHLRTYLPPLSHLSSIVHERVNNQLQLEHVIDSRGLAHIILESIVNWLFQVQLTPSLRNRILNGVMEWRKELAIKGKGDMKLKLEVIDWIKETISNSEYYDIFGDKWNESEYWSLFLQPFLISPIINVTDIAVTLTTDLGKKYSPNHGQPWTEQALINIINLSHPFPVLERWLPYGLLIEGGNELCIQPNTHVFMPIDDIGRELLITGKSSPGWAAFGAGKRACGGRDIAFTLCTSIFHTDLLTSPQFQPRVGHLYSGRNNDSKEDWTASLFQIYVLIKLIYKLIKKRINFNSHFFNHLKNNQILL